MSEKQLLHFVFGGELKNTEEVEFKDLGKLDFVGMYPNFAEAKPRRPGAPRPRRRWTMPRYAISSSICIG